mgnify:CR=1 FL=1
MKLLFRFLGGVIRSLVVGAGAAALTLVFFLILPLIQAISGGPKPDTRLIVMDVAELPPPPPPLEEEPEDEPEEEPPPPELKADAQPLDLSQLELALNPTGFGDNWAAGDFAVRLGTKSLGQSSEELFSIADLDQKPRAIHQPGPVFGAKLRKKAPATVHVLFIVNERGRVESPKVQKSTNSSFDRAAIEAVKKWRFEPGKKNGKPVRFPMRVPITFPKS